MKSEFAKRVKKHTTNDLDFELPPQCTEENVTSTDNPETSHGRSSETYLAFRKKR